ncbi:hypothetical protein [Kitasatospora sp. A2-31]|uniref:hypothetical protein n=1 Tax=Kitasatospora sp. A2-31 TaxID=2916414 RepID=UPI0035AC052B
MDESQSEGEIDRRAAPGDPGGRGTGLRRPGVRGGRIVRDAREWVGWIVAAAGAALCVLGWYGVSGESFAEQQIPYLASSTIPGAALIVAGAVLLAHRPCRGPAQERPEPPERRGGGRPDLTDLRVEQLHALLVEPADGAPPDGSAAGPADPAARPATGTAAPRDTVLLAVPEGTLYHRPDCPLVAGKSRAEPVDAATVRVRRLTPCRICEPREPGGPTTPAGPADAPGPPPVSAPDPAGHPRPTRPGESAPPAG